MQARKIHSKAEQARENGSFLAALQLLDEATILYEKDDDLLGLAEAQGSRSLTLRHLYMQTMDENYLILAKHSSMAAVEIAEKSEITEALALPYFNLAKIQEELKDFGEAVETYRKSVQAFVDNPPELHNRVGVLADMKVHLASCEYKAGDKSALQRTLEALEELQNSDEKDVSRYNFDVWVSGAHMRIAEMLREDKLEKAKEHLKKAKEIIENNPELKLRKEQWERLSSTFK